jgi:hypothetical protein
MLLLIRKAYPAPAESVIYIRQIEYFSSSLTLSLSISCVGNLVSFPSVPLQHIVCIQYTLPVVRQLYSTTQACAAPVSRQLYTAVSYISIQVHEYGTVVFMSS